MLNLTTKRRPKETPTEKKCRCCGEVFPIAEFYLNPGSGSRAARCRDCRRISHREWVAWRRAGLTPRRQPPSPSQQAAHRSRYYKRWAAGNKTRLKEARKQTYANASPQQVEARRQYNKRWAAENDARLRQYRKRYYAENKDRLKEARKQRQLERRLGTTDRC